MNALPRSLPRLDLVAPSRAPITVRWLGTAGFELRHGDHVVLVDPYVTRASIARCVFAPLTPDLAAIARTIERADAIVVGHTHFDHALDVPTIAEKTGARVFGSRSAAHLCRAAGIPASKVVDVESADRTPYEAEVGPFRLRFFPSAHSKLVFGRVPLPGDVDDCDALPMRLHHYKCGAVFTVEISVDDRRIVHLGSADLVESAVPRNARSPDLLLACAAGWTKTPRFAERLAAAFEPHTILLSHWDDFFRPLGEPARVLPAMRVPALVERLHAANGAARVGAIPLLDEVSI